MRITAGLWDPGATPAEPGSLVSKQNNYPSYRSLSLRPAP